jgi:hypothetical protein
MLYLRYMFVSQERERDERHDALRWMAGQLAWEQALDRLRNRAAVATTTTARRRPKPAEPIAA